MFKKLKSVAKKNTRRGKTYIIEFLANFNKWFLFFSFKSLLPVSFFFF